LSAGAAESNTEKMWTKNAIRRKAAGAVENGPISRSFSALRLTVPKRQDCYTFEGFAPRPDEIHTYYYYHYKRTTSGLKEETKWS
ncbi:MAG TPA: hypothetical protein VHK90_11870, partial [Thermoanaerobaculia bacterium]|nr:hypothetical protein [Thermoanaerobaculia bacterium]